MREVSTEQLKSTNDAPRRRDPNRGVPQPEGPVETRDLWLVAQELEEKLDQERSVKVQPHRELRPKHRLVERLLWTSVPLQGVVDSTYAQSSKKRS